MFKLYCTVCKSCLNGKTKWLGHLLRERHQSLSRVQYLRWPKEERDSILVVFSNTSDFGKELLSHFSKDGIEALATDYVWWDDRRQMALIKFENRNAVDKIMSRMEGEGSDLQLPSSTIVQMKRADSYLTFEYNQLILRGATDPKEEEEERGDDKDTVTISCSNASKSDLEEDAANLSIMSVEVPRKPTPPVYDVTDSEESSSEVVPQVKELPFSESTTQQPDLVETESPSGELPIMPHDLLVTPKPKGKKKKKKRKILPSPADMITPRATPKRRKRRNIFTTPGRSPEARIQKRAAKQKAVKKKKRKEACDE